MTLREYEISMGGLTEKMGLFKSAKERELDTIIQRIEMNMSNNYKDSAQSAFKEMEAALTAMKNDGKTKPAVIEKYESILGIYREKLKGYTHKDQKPYWT